MNKITATVVWTVATEVKVKKNATLEEKRDAILDEALRTDIDWKNPVIHDCSDKDLID